MFFMVNKRLFLSCKGTPQEEHDMLFVLTYTAYDLVGKFLPSFALVRAGYTFAHGERGVK